MIEYIFIDLDDTLLDFRRAENESVKTTLSKFGTEADEKILAQYSRINFDQWKLLEEQKITIEKVKTRRFELLFKELGLSASPKAAAELYEELLSEGAYPISGAEDVLKELCKSYRLFLASNGTKRVQKRRLEKIDFKKYFEKIFVSEDMGLFKPDKKYFDACFEQIDGFKKENAVMVGDRLTSDICGGINAGIKTVWINRLGIKNETEYIPDYEIRDISELTELISGI